MPEVLLDAFIVGNVNRNAPRKRIDLTMAAFKRYQEMGGTGYLLLHMAARDSWGWDLLNLAKRLGIVDRLVLTGGKVETQFAPFEKLRLVYAALDLQVSTTVGEGWGLTTAEGMASRIAQVVPRYSALGEWASGGVRYYGITGTQVATNLINTIWAIPDVEELARSDAGLRGGPGRTRGAGAVWVRAYQPSEVQLGVRGGKDGRGAAGGGRWTLKPPRRPLRSSARASSTTRPFTSCRFRCRVWHGRFCAARSTSWNWTFGST
jgi:hypothetical protein